MANTDNLLDRTLCIKDAQNYTLEGFGRSMSFKFNRCDQALLEEGQTCFNQEELDTYLKKFNIHLGVHHNYIDYENIENPIQTIY